ncbi:4007_t:CDS:2 [Cetraspora pellucida]|uniref:4007_t:CDS:1 n=1 Tax=Cetraspora pellucida TaxID=1433469 RepID=A0ACA9K2H7_9GLOM|nr:4007_t:CDS:2 [Cetraspora pellucida]
MNPPFSTIYNSADELFQYIQRYANSQDTENEESDEWKAFLSKWNDTIQSVTEEEFEKNGIHCVLLTLIKTTVTSRIEGAYSTLKAYLQVLTGDLYQVHITIFLVVANQKKEIDAMVASEHIHILLFALNNPLYANVRGKISSFVLKKINDQYQKTNCATSREPLPPCTRFFSKTMGLPCAYTISLLENDQALMLHNIHEHWWILEHLPVLEVEENAAHEEDTLQPLLQNLQERYQEWPRVQQAAAHKTNTYPYKLEIFGVINESEN